MSQKRVATVLALLVGAMTLSAGALLMMENGASALNAAPTAAAFDDLSVRTLVDNGGQLHSDRWNFIIIYESGDLAGSAASLADGRVEGVGSVAGTRSPAHFHFVVGNGQQGRPDGDIEVGNSWHSQEIGTPIIGWPQPNIRTNTYYTNAVGVCAIGNLAQRPMTDNQMQSLLQLVHELRDQCHIPAENVKFAWELSPNDHFATMAETAFADQFRHLMD